MNRSLLVLVVDDDPLVRSFVVRGLKSIGYQTLDARSGEDAISLYAERAADVAAIMLDLEMPGRGGLSAGDAIRATAPGVPILYMSGTDARERVGERLELPHTGFLEKPCTIDELRRGLAGVLAPQPSA